jgi:uncharacterized membrane protein YfcA
MSPDWLWCELVYVLVGLFAGLMAGALGMSGGVVVVPSLIFFLPILHRIPGPHITHVAIGTSLVVLIFTSLAALKAHHRVSIIHWDLIHQLWPGIALGACLGSLATPFIPVYGIKTLLACFLLYAAYTMLNGAAAPNQEKAIPRALTYLASFFIGGISALLGLGGGALIVPFLIYAGTPAREISPVANYCSLVVGLVGTLFFSMLGLEAMAAVPYALGYVYWPAVLGIALPSTLAAPFGVRLNKVVPIRYLQRGFVVILVVTAIDVLI